MKKKLTKKQILFINISLSIVVLLIAFSFLFYSLFYYKVIFNPFKKKILTNQEKIISNIKYKEVKINNQEGLEIINYNDSKHTFSEILIPDKINNKTILSIGKEAFKNNNNIKKINLGNNILKIDESAFEGAKNLKNINLDNVKYIHKNAFNDTGIIEFYVSGNTIFENSSLSNNNKSSIFFNLEYTVLKDKIDFLNIKNNNQSIFFKDKSGIFFDKYYDYSEVYNLNNGNISIKEIYKDKFITLQIPSKIKNKNVFYIDKFAFDNLKTIEKIYLLSGVQEIDNLAFSNSKSLKQFIANDSTLKIIKENAFDGCGSFEYLYLPSNIKKIENNIFNEIYGELVIQCDVSVKPEYLDLSQTDSIVNALIFEISNIQQAKLVFLNGIYQDSNFIKN